MNVLSCAAVRRRLEAFHDRELPPVEHYAVDQHLDGCPRCAAMARAFNDLGSLLREGATHRALSADGASGLKAAVLGRACAEDSVAWPRVVRELFEDMHFVYAGLSATAATVVCFVMLLGMTYFQAPGRDDSLAGMMEALADPGSDRNPLIMDGRVRPPRVRSSDAVPAMLPSASEEDLVFALAAVVTQEGRVSSSRVLLANHHDREAVLRLMNAVSTARFQPATRWGGDPVAVNMVWLVTHTTVRAKTHS
jgi:hypothetical protein